MHSAHRLANRFSPTAFGCTPSNVMLAESNPSLTLHRETADPYADRNGPTTCSVKRALKPKIPAAAPCPQKVIGVREPAGWYGRLWQMGRVATSTLTPGCAAKARLMIEIVEADHQEDPVWLRVAQKSGRPIHQLKVCWRRRYVLIAIWGRVAFARVAALLRSDKGERVYSESRLEEMVQLTPIALSAAECRLVAVGIATAAIGPRHAAA
eukprot:scaffold29206_cov75-Phaeocystis_antarctica.AAC.2